MMYVSASEVLAFFQCLEEADVKYVVLRDVEGCIPDRIDETKDIDLMIHPDHKKKFRDCMKRQGFVRERHPWDFGDNFVFLYAMDKFEFYSRKGMRIDICYQLGCRSTDHGEWVPIDQLIQNSAWENRRKNQEYGYYQLSLQDEFVHLVTRCLFDKKEFKEDYRQRLSALYQQIDKEDVRRKLSLVVFRYADELMAQIGQSAYEYIYDNYIQFTEY